MTILLTSPVFKENGMIPEKYTHDGENISPPLSWGRPANGVKSLALTCTDPDSVKGIWVHWLLYDIPAVLARLTEDIAPAGILNDGTKQGRNDFGAIGYGGPHPASGVHRYVFKIYALDSKTGLNPGATYRQLLDAINGRLLDEGTLTGRYGSPVKSAGR